MSINSDDILPVAAVGSNKKVLAIISILKRIITLGRATPDLPPEVREAVAGIEG